MECQNSFSIGVAADAQVVSADGSYSGPGIKLDLSALAGMPIDGFNLGGTFIVECVDEFGSVVWTTPAKNSVMNAAINSILAQRYCGGTAYSSWYILLVDNSGFTQFVLTDTMASHPGWSELSSANFSDLTRIQWSPGTPSGGSVTNPISSDYHMVGVCTVYGLGLTTSNVVGGTAGLLEATAPFLSGPQPCKGGDTLRISYITSAATN